MDLQGFTANTDMQWICALAQLCPVIVCIRECMRLSRDLLYICQAARRSSGLVLRLLLDGLCNCLRRDQMLKQATYPSVAEEHRSV